MNYQEVAKRFLRDPKIMFDRLYWEIRGIRVLQMKDEHDNNRGALLALAELSEGQKRVEVQTYTNNLDDKDTKDLAELFLQYGSDKSTRHDYYRVYAFLLKEKRNLPIKIFEIGLGTNNMDVLSNMGKDGKPGASLRSFRDWAPHSKVFGADIDSRVLFTDERIETFFLDQTKPEALKKVAERFPPHSFDLIIDDGLHNTWANLNTLNFALGLLKPDGYFVVEDIVDKYLSTWRIAATLLSKEYDCKLIKCKIESVFIVKKK